MKDLRLVKWLAEAFAARSVEERWGDSASPGDVWKAVGGEMPREEVENLADRMVDEPELAREWRIALEMRRSRARLDHSRGGLRFLRPSPRLGALAAALVIAIGAGVWLQLDQDREPVYRGGERQGIESRIDPASELPREDLVLRWTCPEAESRYEVVVATEKLQILYSETDLRGEEIEIPSGALEGIAPGERLRWQVTATLRDGRRLRSPTFVVRVR